MMDRPLRAAIAAAALVSFLVGGTLGAAAGALVATFPERTAYPVLGALGFPVPRPQPAPPAVQPVEEESATVAVVEKVNPAVVSIQISREIVQPQLDFQPFPFDDFFGIPFPQPAPESDSGGQPTLRVVGGGSGFLVTEDGLIVTNRHVVDDQQASYTVILSDGRSFPATVLARDPLLDLALITIEGSGFPTVELGDSDTLKVGQTVLAIGYTLSELENTVTKGVVSGINRRIVAGGADGGAEVIEEAIQTDAAINPGNSGGPLVNLAGQVIGVNVAVNRAAQGVGFAIPISVAKQVIDAVREEGRIVRPWIGVRYVTITPEIARAEKLPVDYGALVVRGDARTELAVIPGSPADKAGLKENDIILEIDGERITERHSLSQIVRRRKPGDAVSLKVLSGGKEKTVTLTLEELKTEE